MVLEAKQYNIIIIIVIVYFYFFTGFRQVSISVIVYRSLLKTYITIIPAINAIMSGFQFKQQSFFTFPQSKYDSTENNNNVNIEKYVFGLG